jgi:hypothetical protein
MEILFNGALVINFDYMTNYITKLFLILFPILLLSCNKDGCSFSSGTIENQSRNLSSFNEIILYDRINLILKEDSIQTLTVATNNNLLNGIKTDVTDSILTIRNENHCTLLANPDQQVNVYISMSQLHQITYYGAGHVQSVNTFHADQFTVDSWYGTGTIKMSILTNRLNAYIRNNNAQLTFTGQSNSTYIYCADEGSIDMFQLSSINLWLNQRSIRDIDVNVSGLLNADIVYKGNVFYKGNPLTIDSLITNSGRLIHVE